MNTTPKEEFIASPHRKAFEDMVQTATFTAACNFALLQMMETQPSQVATPAAGWDNHSQLAGARTLIAILKTLHLKEEPMKQPKQDRLRPEHGV